MSNQTWPEMAREMAEDLPQKPLLNQDINQFAMGPSAWMGGGFKRGFIQHHTKLWLYGNS